MSFTINGTTGINLGTEPLTGSLPDANAPSGSVIQVVQYVHANQGSASSSSSTYADTGLSVSITPSSSSSKILVVVHQGGCSKENNNTGLNYRLVRNSTVIQLILEAGFYNGSTAQDRFNIVSAMYLDAPATTSAVTYKTQFGSFNNNDIVRVNDYGNNTIVSTLTAMEIAG